MTDTSNSNPNAVTKVLTGTLDGLAERLQKEAQERDISIEAFDLKFQELKEKYIAEGKEISDEDIEKEIRDQTPVPVSETKPMQRYVVIFHDDADGWGSCGLALNALTDPGFTFVTKPVNYSHDFSRLLGELLPTDHVYVLDFSFKRKLCDAIYAKVEKLVILDHHKSAEKELSDAPYAIFDMTKSGVLLTYEYFFGNLMGGKDSNGDGFDMVPIPVRLLDVYDLWQKNNPKVNWDFAVGFHLYVKDYFGDYTFWRELMAMDDLVPALWGIIKQKVVWFNDSILELKASAGYSKEHFEGKNFIVYPCSENISLIADAFRKEKELDLDFTASYFIKNGDVIVSLRGTDRTDVLGIAEKNGGGGHAKAAGFFFPFKEDEVINDVLVKKIKESLEVTPKPF